METPAEPLRLRRCSFQNGQCVPESASRQCEQEVLLEEETQATVPTTTESLEVHQMGEDIFQWPDIPSFPPTAPLVVDVLPALPGADGNSMLLPLLLAGAGVVLVCVVGLAHLFTAKGVQPGEPVSAVDEEDAEQPAKPDPRKQLQRKPSAKPARSRVVAREYELARQLPARPDSGRPVSFGGKRASGAKRNPGAARSRSSTLDSDDGDI